MYTSYETYPDVDNLLEKVRRIIKINGILCNYVFVATIQFGVAKKQGGAKFSSSFRNGWNVELF